MPLSCSKKAISIIKGNGFYCLNCLHSFRTKSKLEWHKRVCENKDFCNVILSSGDTKILEFNQYQISDKAPFVIYAELECLIEKIDERKYSSTTKVSELIPSGFSISTNLHLEA